jgi:hypothetical protein
MQVLDTDALDVTVLKFSAHFLGAFLVFLGELSKSLFFYLSFFFLFNFVGSVVDLADRADAETDAVGMKFF